MLKAHCHVLVGVFLLAYSTVGCGGDSGGAGTGGAPGETGGRSGSGGGIGAGGRGMGGTGGAGDGGGVSGGSGGIRGTGGANSTGGITGSGGQIGTGGAGGTTDPATCAQLDAAYQAELPNAKACATNAPVAQCGMVAGVSVGCFQCGVIVQDANKLDALKSRWTAKHCVSQPCLAVACAPPHTGMCVTSGTVTTPHCE